MSEDAEKARLKGVEGTSSAKVFAPREFSLTTTKSLQSTTLSSPHVASFDGSGVSARAENIWLSRGETPHHPGHDTYSASNSFAILALIILF